MMRWLRKGRLWASVLGTTAAFGLAFGQQGGTEAPSGPPKVGDVITLKFRDGPDRQFKVHKVEKQPDGSYLSEVQDVKSGETVTLFDKGDFPPAKAPDPAKGKDAPTPPKTKPRANDAQMQQPPANPSSDRTAASGASRGTNSSNPTPMPDAPKDPPKKPNFIQRLFGKKPPQDAKDSSDSKNSSTGNAGAGSASNASAPVMVPPSPQMPPPVKPTPSFTPPAKPAPSLVPSYSPPPAVSAPVTPPATGATPSIPAPMTGATPFIPPATGGTAEPPRVQTVQPVPPPAAQSAPAVPLFPRMAPPVGSPSVPALPAVPAAPNSPTPSVPATPYAPGIPAVPASPSVPAPFPAMPTPMIPPVPVTPSVSSPMIPGLPNIPVPPGGMSMRSYPPVLQARYATPEETAMIDELRPYVASLRGARAPSDRIYAAWSLAGSRYASDDAVKLVLFRSCTTDPCPLVRACCIDELSKLGYCTREFKNYLEIACGDESEEVKKAAKKAVIKMTPQR